MRKISGFTLVEVLVAVLLTGIILLTGYSTFQKIMQAQSRLGAAIDVQKNIFYTNEKLAALIRDGGTIDYEEYFNRRMLGYGRTTTGGIYTFTNFSHFGNGNVASKPPIYYCGVSGGANGEGCMAPANPGHKLFDSSLYPGGPLTLTNSFTSTPPEHQSYGQYEALAYNYLDPIGWPMPIKLPPIFETTGGEPIKIFQRSPDGLSGSLVDRDPINVGLPELYLIKKNLNNTYTRTYFRHVYADDPFVSGSCAPESSLTGCIGKIQMTKLEDCDTVTSGGANGSDGIIDAWIPHVDFRIGTVVCPTDVTIGDIYKSAHEDVVGGENANLTWVDITAPEMNVIRATFLPNPLKIPEFMSGAGDSAQSPSISVYLEVQLSTKLRNKSFVRPEMNYPRTLITTYDLSE